jgi:hypothetical protein
MRSHLEADVAVAGYHRLNRAVGEAARLTLGIDDVAALPQALRVLDGIAVAGRQSARTAQLIEALIREPSAELLGDALDKAAAAAQKSVDAIEAALELIRQLALTTRRRAPGPITQRKILEIDAAIAEAIREQCG